MEDRGVEERRDAVVEAMVHAWDSYRNYAWGYDELLPLSKGGTDSFSGIGMTVLDALDTLYLMGLESRYLDGRKWVEEELELESVGLVSVFETTIRGLGGLLGAFEVSGDELFLRKAEELGYRLSSAFQDTRLPHPVCFLSNMTCPKTWRGDAALLAEVGSLQLEFHSLSRLSKDEYIQSLGAKTKDFVRCIGLELRPEHNGVPPTSMRVTDGRFVSARRTFGAPSDSFFEYLAKSWIQGGKLHDPLRDMYRASVGGLVEFTETIQGLGSFVREHVNGQYRYQMDHFTCFIPGMLVTGLDAAESPQQRKDWIELAKNITDTCLVFYNRGVGGLAGETIFASNGEISLMHGYELRPETIEALFYMWRQTKDEQYREWAWEIFQRIESNCRISTGYAALEFRGGELRKKNIMHSFFLAETLKYLYLIFSDDSVLPLDKFVLTTEAHPLRIDTCFSSF